MRERQQTTRRIVRFRQWSRKGYAAFASIGICVTIGRLRKNVTERALRKQSSPDAAMCTEHSTEESPKREAYTAPNPDVWQELLQPLPPVSVPVGRGSKDSHNNIIKEVPNTSSTRLGGVEPRPYMQMAFCRGGALLRPKRYNNPYSL